MPQTLGSTSSNLLNRAKQREPDAWQRLADLYVPQVYLWCRQFGLQSADAADVTQETFQAVMLGLENYAHAGRRGSFRAWLKTIARNRVTDFHRRRRNEPAAAGGTDATLAMAEFPEPDRAAAEDAVEDTAGGFWARAANAVRAEFEPRTWEAFWQTAVEGRRAAEVATELGMTVDNVYQAKSRVLHRLRQEFEGLGAG